MQSSQGWEQPPKETPGKEGGLQSPKEQAPLVTSPHTHLVLTEKRGVTGNVPSGQGQKMQRV